ncbi:hypothetical protein [Paraburkholderia atlantica]|uniref:hypothetical protein n=1 Tax=Paraburkholderia atlantica TaxID=2654982 RepID=UPI003D1FA866
MQTIALFICCLFPTAFCLAAAWIAATPECVLTGTLLGGAVAVVAALAILK